MSTNFFIQAKAPRQNTVLSAYELAEIRLVLNEYGLNRWRAVKHPAGFGIIIQDEQENIIMYRTRPGPDAPWTATTSNQRSKQVESPTMTGALRAALRNRAENIAKQAINAPANKNLQ